MLLYQLKIPSRLVPADIKLMSRPSGLIISVAHAESIVRSCYDLSLGQMAEAMLWLQSTSSTFSMDTVLEIAGGIAVNEGQLASTIGGLAVLGSQLPSRISGGPLQLYDANTTTLPAEDPDDPLTFTDWRIPVEANLQDSHIKPRSTEPSDAQSLNRASSHLYDESTHSATPKHTTTGISSTHTSTEHDTETAKSTRRMNAVLSEGSHNIHTQQVTEHNLSAMVSQDEGYLSFTLPHSLELELEEDTDDELKAEAAFREYVAAARARG